METNYKTFLKAAVPAFAAAAFMFFQLTLGSQASDSQASKQPGIHQDLTSSLEDQEELSVTVYNSNIGLVKIPAKSAS